MTVAIVYTHKQQAKCLVSHGFLKGGKESNFCIQCKKIKYKLVPTLFMIGWVHESDTVA